MAGRNPIGHRVRIGTGQAARLERGAAVVRDRRRREGARHGERRNAPAAAAGVYLPAVPGSQGALNMIVRGRGDPLSIAPRVRELAMVVDPDIRVEQISASTR